MNLNQPNTVLAVLSRNNEAILCLKEKWESIVPDSFPAKDVWNIDTENGVAVFGSITNKNKSILAISHDDNKPKELSNKKINQGLSTSGALYLNKLNHPFALIYWNTKQQIFMVARDYVGQMEMFCYETPSYYFFSSDISQLLDMPKHKTELNYEAAVHYLLFGLPPVSQTLVRNIKKLPAGQYFEISAGGLLTRKRYYSPLSSGASRTLSDIEKISLVNKLDDAILSNIGPNRQALLLSGGVDSSYIAYSIAKHHKAKKIDAYSMEFEYPYKDNETHYARAVAKDNNINFHTVTMSSKDALNAFEVILNMPQPTSAWASLTHYHMLNKIYDDGHTSFISGLGADEVFGGYSRYLKYYRKYRFYEESYTAGIHVDPFDSILLNPRHVTNKLFPGIPEFFSFKDFRKASRDPFKQWSPYFGVAQFYRECRELKSDAQFFEMMVAHECQNRIPDLLFTSFESMGRTVGVHGRYPFLAKDIIEVACGLGAIERFWLDNKRWKNKRLLKEIASSRVPSSILDRPIGSYTTPITLWLRNKEFNSLFRYFLLEGKLWETGLISESWRTEIDMKIFNRNSKVKGRTLQTAVEQAWIMVTLAAWYENWIH